MGNVPAPDIKSTPRIETISIHSKPKETIWKRLIQQFKRRQENETISQITDNQAQTSSSHKVLEQIASAPTIKPFRFAPDRSQFLPNMELSSLAKPPIKEINPNEAQFMQHQTEFLAKHSDEVKPVETGPFAVAIVKRAYRELSNGNLTESLISLASQNVPTREFCAYFDVNNIRMAAIASDVWDKNAAVLQRLPEDERNMKLKELIKKEYVARRTPMNSSETQEFTSYNKASLEKRAQDYKENQATLTVLKSLTLAVNALSREPNNLHNQIINQSLKTIKQAANGFMTEAQLQTLLRASQAVIKKRIAIMGVDCSSFNKAFLTTNHGQATNEAAHIALAQGAKYIDVSDMDEFHGPNALREVVNLADQNRVDVLIRPLIVVTPQHPEQLNADSPTLWADLVSYYTRSLTSTQKGYFYPSNRSSGTQIVSARAFRRHEYPHRGMNEDYDYANEMRNDIFLIKRFANSSDIRLANRGRDVSWDGGSLGTRSYYATVESLRGVIEPEQKNTIASLVRLNTDVIDKLHELQRKGRHIPDFAAMYEQERKQFFEEVQAERVNLRRFFLGIRTNGRIAPNGLLPSVWKVWQSHPEWNADQIIQAAKLRPRQRAFLDQNPLLLKGALQELQRVQQTSTTSRIGSGTVSRVPEIFQSSTKPGVLPLYSAIQHIANSLPELFGRPLTEEPSYDIAVVGKLPPGEINQANWIHLARAQRWFSNYLTNLDRENGLPKAIKDELTGIADKLVA